MGIKKEWVVTCDMCGKPLRNADSGYVLIGMLLTPQLNEDGKPSHLLAGGEFKQNQIKVCTPETKVKDLNSLVLCKECMAAVLGLNNAIPNRHPLEKNGYIADATDATPSLYTADGTIPNLIDGAKDERA